MFAAAGADNLACSRGLPVCTSHLSLDALGWQTCYCTSLHGSSGPQTHVSCFAADSSLLPSGPYSSCLFPPFPRLLNLDLRSWSLRDRHCCKLRQASPQSGFRWGERLRWVKSQEETQQTIPFPSHYHSHLISLEAESRHDVLGLDTSLAQYPFPASV